MPPRSEKYRIQSVVSDVPASKFRNGKFKGRCCRSSRPLTKVTPISRKHSDGLNPNHGATEAKLPEKPQNAKQI